MRPLEFLREEFQNVERALQETLRLDYGPEQSAEFYDECARRLDRIRRQIAPGALAESDHQSIAAHLGDLGYIATLISLIERSRLGEFSWPFADELRDLAKALLQEADMFGAVTHPIVHVVADGRGYRIRNEDFVQTASSARRFVIVFFPRPLKDHVLLHTIFGHELGHAALETTQAGPLLQSQAYPALAADIMSDDEKATAWLNAENAPSELKAALIDHENKYKEQFRFRETIRNLWLHELICDLCGLLLFGPAFLASHAAIIKPSHPNPLKVDLLEPTHPPYAVRHKMLVQAMRILQWQKTLTLHAHGDIHLAEVQFLSDLADDPYPKWAQIFTESELENAVKGIQSVLGAIEYKPPTPDTLLALVDRLKNKLPPILDELQSNGRPILKKTDFRQILHAGWVFWAGRSVLSPPSGLSFTLRSLYEPSV
jgi:hypothetical protein